MTGTVSEYDCPDCGALTIKVYPPMILRIVWSCPDCEYNGFPFSGDRR